MKKSRLLIVLLLMLVAASGYALNHNNYEEIKITHCPAADAGCR